MYLPLTPLGIPANAPPFGTALLQYYQSLMKNQVVLSTTRGVSSLHHRRPRLPRVMEYTRMASMPLMCATSAQGLADHARHVIEYTLEPSFLELLNVTC